MFDVFLRLRCPTDALNMLHGHYDSFKHESSGWSCGIKCGLCMQLNIYITVAASTGGFPHEILCLDFFVPGSTSRRDHEKFRGKSQFQEIMQPTEKSVIVYFQRAMQEHLTTSFYVVKSTVIQ